MRSGMMNQNPLFRIQVVSRGREDERSWVFELSGIEFLFKGDIAHLVQEAFVNSNGK